MHKDKTQIHKVFSTHLFKYLILCFILMSCSNSEESDSDMIIDISDKQAVVTNVSYVGEANNYTLSVTIESPDTGCDQYADWWEVFTEDGVLLYRRILGHSHVNEQPFTRSGGAVEVGPDDFIYVRAHMNNLGYGSLVFSGTLGTDLRSDTLDTSFAMELATMSPLPGDCAF